MLKRKLLLCTLCIFISAFLVACMDISELNTTTEVSTEATEAVEASVGDATTTEAMTEAASEDEPEKSPFDMTEVPEYEEEAFVNINDGVPFFTDEEKDAEEFESYSELDKLGRCGVAYALLSKAMMPDEERGEIGDIKPSGWHTVKYNDLIDGNYLYNRCHLIAYSLAGENSNEKNLITGTSYMNTEGMLSFENVVGDYLKHTNNHVLYRVTPIFEGDNLVASGVEMEGWSIEDNGKGVCFNVFCYNVQPFIGIDYATGESWIDEKAVARAALNKDDETTEVTTEVTSEDTTETTEASTEDTTVASTEATTESTTEVAKGPVDEQGDPDYVVNTNSRKIHRPTCSSVDDMAERNKWYFYGTLEELKEMGYEPCKRCLKGINGLSCISHFTLYTSSNKSYKFLLPILARARELQGGLKVWKKKFNLLTI